MRNRPFTENAIQNAVQGLKGFRATGATHQNEQAYDLLCLGTSVPQTVEGDTKSFTINYIDWKNPENNIFHCTAEFSVERLGHQKHYIPDIVLFVNGIPLGVIECKRSAYTIARAVEDKAVKPLLYEARHVPQPVEKDAIDGWFEKVTMGLTNEQKADPKRKFSREKQLNKATQKVRMIAWDVSLHYAMTYRRRQSISTRPI